jgi:hypothetical protein
MNLSKIDSWISARRPGTDLNLVERKQPKAFKCLVEEVVVGLHHIRHEDVRRLAAELHRLGDQMLGRIAHDLFAGRCLAGERDLGNARVGGNGLTEARHICAGF